MKNRSMSQSFRNAWTGVTESVAGERNMRVHLAAMLVAGSCGLILSIDALRWAVLALACTVVITTEMLNTALERLVDMLKTDQCEEARQVKDMAAGAVLIAAVGAVLCGLAVFTGPILALFGY